MRRPSDDEIRTAIVTMEYSLRTWGVIGDEGTMATVAAAKIALEWALGEGNAIEDMMEVLGMAIVVAREKAARQ